MNTFSAMNFFLLGGVAFLAIGFSMFLIRRSLLLALAGVQICLTGIALMFMAFGAHDPSASSRATLILVLGIAHALLGVAVAVGIFRQRASVNLDEFRELRG